MLSLDREKTIAVFCSIIAMLCFSSVPVFLRLLRHSLDAWTVNAVRYSVAAVFWLPFVVVLGRRLKASGPDAARPSIWRAALVPTVVNLAGQVGWAAAPYFVDAPTIGFFIRTSFLFTMLLGFLFIPAERSLARRPMFLVGSAVCLAGVALMFAGKLSLGTGDPSRRTVGLLILLGTAACWGAYAVSVRRLLAGYPLRLAFGVISLYTTGGLIVLMFLLGDWGRLAALPPRPWVLLVVSGFIGITFAHVIYHRAIHGIGPVISSGIHLGGPFVTYLWAAIFLAETMTGLQLLGGLAVVAGGVALVKAKAEIERLKAAQPETPSP